MAILDATYNIQEFDGDASRLHYPLTLYNNPNTIISVNAPIEYYYKYNGSTENYYKFTITASDGDVYCFPIRIGWTSGSVRYLRVGVIAFSATSFEYTIEKKHRNFSSTSSHNTAVTFTDSGGNTLYGGSFTSDTLSLDIDSGDIYTDPADDPLTTPTINDLTNWLDTARSITWIDVSSFSVYVSHDLGYMAVTLEPYIEDNDPYSDIPENEPAGGDKDFDDTSEPIDFPQLPNISIADSGLVQIYNPSLQQLKDLSSYMWSPLFDIDTVKKIYANPIDVILGLSILPLSIQSTTQKRVKIGGLDTGLDFDVASSQFVEKDMGTIHIKTGTGGSYLDYSPYTKASIYLPYIGWKDISIDDIMDKDIHLKYYFDIVSGSCVAMLKCKDSLLYEWTGQGSINIPLTGIDYSTTIGSAISAVGHIASTVGGFASGAMSLSSGNIMNGVGAMAGAVGNGLSGLASDVMSSKPQFPKSGSLGGAAGVMGCQQAYICLVRPRMARPARQSNFMGYPAYITYKISDLAGSGFTAFSDVRLKDMGLTTEEMTELDSILKGGCFL